MYAQKNPSYHPIPELSLEAMPMPREGQLFPVPGRGPEVKVGRSPKTCHTPMDWTGYWVERMRKELVMRNPMSAAPAGRIRPQGSRANVNPEAYASALEGFLLANPGAPSKHGPDVIGAYLLRCKEERGLGASATNLILSALLFFYEHVLKAPKCISGIPRVQAAASVQVTGKYQPVLNAGKVKSRLDGMDNHKHRLILSLAYACGLKNSELLGLKLSDLHVDEGSVTVRNRRGTKERKVAMPGALAADIAEYRKRYLPIVYLIESVQAGKPIGKRTLESVFENENEKKGSGLSGAGKDLRFIQGLLGYFPGPVSGFVSAKRDKS